MAPDKKNTPNASRVTTSRSFKLATSKFCLDFTWQKVEEKIDTPVVQPITYKPSQPKENFRDVLHRHQIESPNIGLPTARLLIKPLGPLNITPNEYALKNYGQTGILDTDPDQDNYV